MAGGTWCGRLSKRKEERMGSLTQEQSSRFDEQGFLVVEGLLDPVADLDPVIREYEDVLDCLVARLFAGGAIPSQYADLPFGRRLIRVQQDTSSNLVQHFDFSLPKSGIRINTPIWLGKAVFDIIRNERLLDAVESLIGPEIYSNPVQHVRLKLPERVIPDHLRGDSQLSVTPWHQDNGVITEEADGTDMVTIWFPLWDAPVSAGPLQVVPRSHRSGLLTHCPAPAGISIPRALLDHRPMLSLPMRRGDVLFMHKLTAHSSLPNNGEDIRWSFDLRYHPVGQPSGRDAFPGFVARSRSAPGTEQRDAAQWAQSWLNARERLAHEPPAVPLNRWDGNAPACA
jgi:phytanoyl-CoA hydroxylase